MIVGNILMTALVPTKGHAYLISFADQYLSTLGEDYVLNVIVSGRSKEPTKARDRIVAFEKFFYNNKNIFFSEHSDDDAPQNPTDSETEEKFWAYWRETILDMNYNFGKPDYIFASEKYGIDVAKSVDAEFIPVDIGRHSIRISGTKVRNNPVGYFKYALPTFQHHLQKTVTIFGAESTGKSTITTSLGDYWGLSTPEWARNYLETIGTEVTDAKMEAISRGQFAMEQSFGKGSPLAVGIPVIVRDTDLLSTIGYYRIYNGKEPQLVRDLFAKSKADLYIVMNSGIPFEPDPLRYGGDVRESTDQFWIDLLKEFDCNYVLMPLGNRQEQLSKAIDITKKFFRDNPVYTFVRD